MGVCAMAAPACLAGEPSLADASAQLAALLATASSYSARFEQVVINRFGEPVQTTTGTMHWQRPRRLRWEVDEPYPQLVLTDGESLWVYDPDIEQASVRPLAQTADGSAAVFLTGGAEGLAERFAVRVDAGANLADGALRFVLTPRDQASVLRDLALTFSADGLLTGLDIADHVAGLTRTTFSDGVRNPALEPRLFTFEAPEGVDVIGQAATAAANAPSAP